MKKGEKGNWQGENFFSCSRDLVLKLGYKELFSGKYDIDFLGEPPHTGSSMVTPRFAPSGITAFEFTSQGGISDHTARKLATKIQRIKGKYTIEGGVVVCDIRVPDNLYKDASKLNVHIWDLRDCSFCAEKCRIFNILNRRGQTREEILNDRVTYLWTLDRTTPSGFFKGYLCVLHHHPTVELTVRDMENIFAPVHNVIADKLKSIGCIPIEIELILLIRPYVSRDVPLGINNILNKFSDEESITYTLNGLYSFYIAPWHFGLYSQI